MAENNSDPLFQRWTVLDHLLKELIQSYEIPRDIIKSLQYAKALINFYKEDPEHPDRARELPRIEGFLRDAEMGLMSIAENEGKDFVNDWDQKLYDASTGKEVFKYHKLQSQFIAGMPANFDFVRFNFKDPIAEERFYEICEYEGVIIEYDDNDSSVFVFGEKPNITKALKEMASFFQEQQQNA